MTRFLADVRFARPGALDGVGRYLWHTMAAVPDVLRDDERLVLLCVDEDRDRWRALFAQHACTTRVVIVPTDVPIASLSQYGAWPRLIDTVRARFALDVVYYPQYEMPRVAPGLASVATLYDFTPLDEASYFGGGRAWRRIAASALLSGTCARATLVTTLSSAIGSWIEERVPALAGRVRITKPGPSALAGPPAAAVRHAASFVYVGNHRPHKRVPLLLRAFARAQEELPDARLTLMGRRDARFPLPALPAGVELVDGASDEDVAARLSRARALVFPSVGEGYGFPVAEAQSLATPAVVVDAGSLPEVAAGAALVVPRDDVDALARAMVRISHDDVLWRDLSARALTNHQLRSWRDTAVSLVDTWREARARHARPL